MDMAELIKLNTDHSVAITVVPINGTARELSHYPFVVSVPGYNPGSVVASIRPMTRLDAHRDRVLEVMEGISGDAAVITVFDLEEMGKDMMTRYMGFADSGDAMLFKLKWAP